jgi:hypothetical protein
MNACGWGAGLSPPLIDSTKRNVSCRNTTKALQKDFRSLEEIYDQKRQASEISIVRSSVVAASKESRGGRPLLIRTFLFHITNSHLAEW